MWGVSGSTGWALIPMACPLASVLSFLLLLKRRLMRLLSLGSRGPAFASAWLLSSAGGLAAPPGSSWSVGRAGSSSAPFSLDSGGSSWSQRP